jgi:hypothetical protein
MTCDENKILLMDFLYNEISAESETSVRAHLQSCSTCRFEYEALSRASLTLKAWDNEDPRLHLVFVRDNQGWLSALKEKLFPAEAPLLGKLAGVAVGIVLGVLLVSAVLNTEISFNKGNFAYRTSLAPRPVATADSQLVAQMQQQNQEMFNRLLLASRQEQREEFNRTLAQFAAEINRQRESDLQLVGQGLDAFHQHTNSRLERNDEMLNRLLQSVEFQPKE